MNEDYDKEVDMAYKVCYACIVGIIMCIAISLLCGCKSIEYVPVPEYHHDSIYFTKVQFDSIYVKDSTNQKEYSRNDTFFIEKTKWLTKYKEKLIHDTLYQSKVDSIPVPYKVVKEVERKMSKTEKGLMGLGTLSLIGLVVFLTLKIKRFLPLR